PCGGTHGQGTSLGEKAQLRGQGGVELGRDKIEGIVVFFVIEAEETETETEINSEARCNLPVVFDVRFDDCVIVVIDALAAVLSVSCQRSGKGRCAAPEQQVSKSIAGAVGIGSGEGYGALNVAGVC